MGIGLTKTLPSPQDMSGVVCIVVFIFVVSLLATFSCSLEATTGPPVQELRSELEDAIRDDDKTAIIELSRRILNWAPKDAKVWEQLARTQLAVKDLVRCAKTLDLWEQTIKPRPALLDDLRGDLANANDQLKEAEHFWDAYLVAEPRSIGTLDKLADLLERRKAWGAGIDILNRAIVLKDTAGRRVLRARLYLKMRNWDAALADIHRANRLDATSDSVKTWLPKLEKIQIYLVQIKALDVALAKPEQAAVPWLERARLLTLAEQPDLALNDAIEAFDNRWPKESMRARIQSGEALLDLGRGGEAANMKVSRDLLRSQDHHVDEKTLSALGEWDLRIAQSPGEAEPLVERAHILRQLNQFTLALADAQSAIEIAPENGAAHFEAAHALEGLDRLPEALRQARKATDLNPDSAVSLSYRGILEARGADFAAAIESQNRSLMIRESVAALRERAKCQLRLGRVREAQADAQRISELGPEGVEP